MQIENWQAVILGVVEGLTEFLPISSTGDLILSAHAMVLEQNVTDLFSIFIQIGAILAVCVYYWRKIGILSVGILKKDAHALHVLKILVLATLPAIILGLTLGKKIKLYFFNPISISIALIIGGLIILWVERRAKNTVTHSLSELQKSNKFEKPAEPAELENLKLENISTALAIKIGLCQTLALIPGTSRSGATIIGAVYLGLPRQLATEFSFFLGIPLIIGAGLYDLYKHMHVITPEIASALMISFVVSFVFALICIHALLKFIAKHSFTAFAYYRIIFGLLLLLWFSF
jgi:undecaprenyl-diphosphatase